MVDEQNGRPHLKKWYGLMVRIKWYTNKISNQAIDPAPTDNNDLFINPASTLTSIGFLCVFIIYL